MPLALRIFVCEGANGTNTCFQIKMAYPKNKYRYFYLLLGLLGINAVFGQAEMSDRRTIIVRDSSLAMKVQILNHTPTRFRCRNKLTYYYHHKDRIHQSQGGYTGSLLDGDWESYFPSNLLSSQGCFEKGLKSGTWRYWYANGRLQREEHWKNGRLHGPFTEFSMNGQPSKQGRYRLGLLHGVILGIEEGKVTEKTRYRRGKQKKGFVLKSLFKRKKTQSDETTG
jgi:hypothetical protein